MIVVIDTNVFVSALIGVDSPPAQLFRMWQRKQLEIATSEPILAEFARVLFYPQVRSRIHRPDSFLYDRIHDLRKSSILVAGDFQIDVIKEDPTDNKFLACAME